MKINRKSWHCRLISDIFAISDPKRLPKTLCSYFWHLIDAIVICTAALLTFPIWGPIVGIVWLFSRFIDWCAINRFAAPKIQREPGLIRSYYRAVKSKTCPIIKYE